MLISASKFAFGLLPFLSLVHAGLLGGRGGASAITGYCKVEEEDCSLSSFQDSGITRWAVEPGGDARCGSADAGAYFFQVDPGRNGQENNLLIGFQGGGYFLGFGNEEGGKESSSFWGSGIFDLDKSSEENPLRDWTKVVITYCTGDLHAGDGVDVADDGREYHFNGRQNAMAAFNWIIKNIPNPDRVYIYGCSAGSSGVQFWSNRILSYYKTRAKPPIMAVTMDSNVGLSRPEDGLLEAAVQRWKICSSELGFTSAEVDLCEQGLFTSKEIQAKSQAAHRDTPFAYTTYKLDTNLFGRYCEDGFLCDQAEFYADQNEFINDLTRETDNNVIAYWVSNSGHCMINTDAFYKIEEQTPLTDWVANLVTHEDKTLKTDCKPRVVPDPYDGGCDEDLLAAQFVSAGSTGEEEDFPCPCTCDLGSGVVLTRPATEEIQCVTIDDAISALDKLPGVECLTDCELFV